MSTIITAVTSTDVTAENFLASAAQGTVRFYTERSNGTTRHVQFFAPDTTERETAEWVLAQRDAGVTMRAIAKEMHLSVPSVRRIINSLLLTLEVEDYDTDEVTDLLALVDSDEPALVAEQPAVVAEQPQVAEHDCHEYAVPYVSDGPLGHGWECGACGAFLQAG